MSDLIGPKIEPQTYSADDDVFNQGCREKFRALGQKFCLGLLVSGAPKSRDKQKKVRASADVRILAQNQVMNKKRLIASADVQISAQHLVMSKIIRS